MLLAAVGDVVIDRPDPSSAFDRVRHVLEQADVRFGNCEAVYAAGMVAE